MLWFLTDWMFWFLFYLTGVIELAVFLLINYAKDEWGLYKVAVYSLAVIFQIFAFFSFLALFIRVMP